MTSEDDKALYTLQSLLHARVIALGDMLFERLSTVTNESEANLHVEWRDRSRQQFREVTRQAIQHPGLPSTIPAETMLATAEAMWRLEDAMRKTTPSEPSDQTT